MADLRSRFGAVDRVPAPDLWPRITGETEVTSSTPPRQRGAAAWLAMAAVVTAVVLAATVLVRADRDDEGVQIRPAEEPGGGTGERQPAGSAPMANGLVAFVRADPASAEAEGAIPQASLFVVGPSGTAPVRLAAAAPRSTPTWSPDGSKLAFVREGIVVIAADGTGERRIVPCAPPACDGVGSPAWSPDGKRIAFWSSQNGDSGVWVAPAGGGGPALLSRGLQVSGAPSWSPDGRELALFGRTDAGDGSAPDSVLVVDAGNGRVVRTISQDGLDIGEGIAWNPGGDRLAVAGVRAGRRGPGIHLLDRDGAIVQSLDGTTAADSHPAWSPDGKQIVFTRAVDERGSDGFTGDLYVVDVSASGAGQARPLTSGPGLDCCPSWQGVASG